MNHPLNPMTDPSGYPMNHPINLTDNPIGLKSAYLTDGSSDIRIDQIRIAPLFVPTNHDFLTGNLGKAFMLRMILLYRILNCLIGFHVTFNISD